MAIPIIQVQTRDDFSPFACLVAQFPKAIAPPARSIKAMILPIRPQTIISHAMSGSSIVSVKMVLNSLKTLTVFAAIIRPIRQESTRDSKILLVIKMYTIRNVAGNSDQAPNSEASVGIIKDNSQVTTMMQIAAISARRGSKPKSSSFILRIN